MTDGLSKCTREAFTILQASAHAFGIDLKIASGYRSIERQVAIWRRKADPSYTFNLDGRQIKSHHLSDEQWLTEVMKWSAVPGLSRHHWGTDIDVYDKQAIPERYRLQLTSLEYSRQGIFQNLCQFLDHHLPDLSGSGFFRPYLSTANSIAVEPWHLSFAPESEAKVLAFDSAQAYQTIPFDALRGGHLIKKNLDEIITQYVYQYDKPS